MNELLRAIAEKERRLEAESLSARPAPRRWTLWPFLLAALVGAAVVCVDAAAARWQVDPGEMKHALTVGQIPWQHYTQELSNGKSCDVWLSARGLAQIDCGGEVAYRGTGITDGDGFHPWPSGTELRMSALRPAAAVAPWPRLALDVDANRARMQRFVREEVFPCIATDVPGVSPKLWFDSHWPTLHLAFAELDWIVHSDECLGHVVNGWVLPRLTGDAPDFSFTLRVAHGRVRPADE
jgi:hypothetical protein